MKTILLTLCLFFGGVTHPLAAQRLSSTPAAFVDVGFGARPVALGSAYVGLADDVHSVVWNPAGLGAQTDQQAVFSYIDQLGLFTYQHIALATPLGGQAHGVGLAVIATGDEALREMTLLLAYGRSFGAFALGVGIKYRRASFGNNTLREADFLVFEPDEIQTGFDNQVRGSANGFGIDIGLLYRPHPRMQFGLMLRDAYAPLFWTSNTRSTDRPARGAYNEGLPIEAALGTMYRIDQHFIVTVDYSPALQHEGTNTMRFGLEATVFDLLALRGGMQQHLNDQPDEKYALGFELNVPIVTGLRMKAGYTYLIEQLADSQHASLMISF